MSFPKCFLKVPFIFIRDNIGNKLRDKVSQRPRIANGSSVHVTEFRRIVVP